MRLLLPVCALLFSLAACTGSRVLPAETGLFPKQEDTWWLVHFSGTDGQGMGVAVSLLYTRQPERCVTTVWQEAGQQVAWGEKVQVKAGTPPEPSFPLRLKVVQDSTAATWYCDLKRDGLRIHTGELSNGQFFALNTRWPRQMPFAMVPFSQSPEVWTSPPLRATGRMDAGTPVEVSGQVRIHAFHQAEALIALAKGSPVVWLDILFPGERSLTLLAAVPGTGDAPVIRQLFVDAAGHPQPVPLFRMEPQERWESPVSHKQYPLGFRLTGGENGKSWLVIPASETQEAGSGQNSLWMGAVYLLDPETNAIVGGGNMAILVR